MTRTGFRSLRSAQCVGNRCCRALRASRTQSRTLNGSRLNSIFTQLRGILRLHLANRLSAGLTTSGCLRPFGSFRFVFGAEPGRELNPINPTIYCHHTTGEIVLFAPDHNFVHIVPLPGCPKYSLYRIPGAETSSNWVSSIANQWLESIS